MAFEEFIEEYEKNQKNKLPEEKSVSKVIPEQQHGSSPISSFANNLDKINPQKYLQKKAGQYLIPKEMPQNKKPEISLEEQQEPFSDFIKDYETKDKENKTWLGRGAARTLANVGESLLGTAHNLSPLEQVKHHIAEHITKKTLKLPHEKARERLNEVTGGYTEPKTEGEKEYDENIKFFTDQATNIGPNFVRNAAKAVVGTIGGYAVEKGIKALGGSEVAQKIGKHATAFASQLIGGNIRAADQEGRDILALARRLHATPQQEALLTKSLDEIRVQSRRVSNSNFMRNFIESLISNGRNPGLISRGMTALNNTLDNLPVLRRSVQRRMATRAQRVLDDLQNANFNTHESQAASREITEFINDLNSGIVDPKRLVNSYRRINALFDLVPEGERYTQAIKPILEDALHQAHPQLGRDFTTLNRMYEKAMHLQQNLNPRQIQFLNKAEHGALIGGLIALPVFGGSSLGGAVLGVGLSSGIRHFIQHMQRNLLINPNYQNLMHSAQQAVLNRSTTQLNAVVKAFEKEKEKYEEEEKNKKKTTKEK